MTLSPLEAVQSLLTRVIWHAVADLSIEAYRGENHLLTAADLSAAQPAQAFAS